MFQWRLVNDGIKWFPSHFREIDRLLDCFIDQSNYRNVVTSDNLQAQADLFHS